MPAETYYDEDGVERCDRCEQDLDACACVCEECGDNVGDCACDD